jgi:hypothetical protein
VSVSAALRALLVAVGTLGAVVLGAASLLSFASPLTIERLAREVMRIEVERRVGERIDALSDARIVGLAQRALGRTQAEIDAARDALKRDVPRRVAEAVADLLKADCECRKRLVERSVRAEHERLGSLEQLRGRLSGLIESRYAATRDALLREWRVFTATNALASALLALLAWARRGAALQLALTAAVLLGAVGISAGTYLFSQDWLHTIVFGDYVGWAYGAYLGLVALALADVAFNRARVAARLLNALFHSVGSAMQVAPC